jgi:transcriptional regulator with XRE-family HTH domain
MVRTLVGTRIRERRRALKRTQTSLAQAVGISPSYLNLIEHNRRGIAGRTLIALAAELNVDATELADGADGVLVNHLINLAKSHEAAPETNQTEEFIGRYPGWARLLASLGQTAQSQRESLAALTDRMNHDPFLSETMHQILSNITVIRSTAGILDTTPDISEERRARFLKNIRSESQRLSATAQSMVDFFDAPQTAEATPARNQDEDFWSKHGHFLPELEDGTASIEQLLADHPGATATTANGLRKHLLRYRNICQKLPLAAFLDNLRRHPGAPLALARLFDVPLADVLFRLAHLPDDPDIPVYGLIEVDMSGAVSIRKELPEFALPQFSSACPLWPVYRAFGAPGQIIRTVLEMPTGVQITSFSIATTQTTDQYDMPAFLQASMAFTADTRALLTPKPQPVLVGLHCSVCPRKQCDQRRVDYILS